MVSPLTHMPFWCRAIAKLNEYSAPLIEALTREAQEHIEEFSQQVHSVLGGCMARLHTVMQTGHVKASLLSCIALRSCMPSKRSPASCA